MEQSFWQERWDSGRIGFHQEQGHPVLQRLGPELVRAGEQMLVPLCGKTQDLLVLAELGRAADARADENAAPAARVTGVEFVPEAVRDFFRENSLEFREEPANFFEGLSGPPGLRMYSRDFFAAPDWQDPPAGRFTLIYDRAALVALDPPTRQRYSETLRRLCDAGGRILLIAFEYDQSVISGPPFSIPRSTVDELFASRFTIEERERRILPALNPRFTEAGQNEVVEAVYLLTRES